jgi:hypothetical protein
MAITSGASTMSMRLRCAAWLASWIEHAYLSEPALGGFDGRAHDRVVAEFGALDRERLERNVAQVRARHARRLFDVLDAHRAQAELVRRESQKKTLAADAIYYERQRGAEAASQDQQQKTTPGSGYREQRKGDSFHGKSDRFWFLRRQSRPELPRINILA